MKKGVLTSEFWLGLGSGAAALDMGLQDPAWQVRSISILAVAGIAAFYALSRAKMKGQAQ